MKQIYYPVYNIYIRQGQLVVFVYSFVWRFFNDFFFFFFSCIVFDIVILKICQKYC